MNLESCCLSSSSHEPQTGHLCWLLCSFLGQTQSPLGGVTLLGDVLWLTCSAYRLLTLVLQSFVAFCLRKAV